MAKTGEQVDRTTAPTSVARGEATRAAILVATAELIGELGWGGVSTRAIAARAGVPHGAVSYHFRGKQEVLREAALAATEELFDEALPPLERTTIEEVLRAATQWYGRGITERRQTLMVEVMMACTRDDVLRDGFADLLGQYRALFVETIRAEQARGSIAPELDADGLSAVLIAALDGMLLHTLVGPEYDIARALATLGGLVYGPGATPSGGGRE